MKAVNRLLLAGAALALVVPATATAWTIGNPSDDDGCHELITAQALRNVRAMFPSVPPIKPTRDEAALIADVQFEPPADLVSDLAGMALLLAVRDNDLKGTNPLSTYDLIQVHGNPETQDEHCIRSATDDNAQGNATGLEGCMAFIRQRAIEALDGLDANGAVDPTKRMPLDIFLAVAEDVRPELPVFYVKMGQALHALEDGFTHTYRSADGMQVTVMLNWIDFVAEDFDEPRDGPPHRTELDQCQNHVPTIDRNFALATAASTELLAAAADPSLSRTEKLARFDATLTKYFTFDPGCTADNNWCSPPEATVPPPAMGCSTGGATGSLAILLVLAATLVVRRRRVALVTIALAALAVGPRAARADDAPPKDNGPAFGVAMSAGVALSRPGGVARLGARYRITDNFTMGLDGEWNPWVSTSPFKVRAGVANAALVGILRFPMRYERVNLRSTLRLGTSTLLFDVYGAPKFSTGPFGTISVLGIDYEIADGVRIVFDPAEIAVAVPEVGDLPLIYQQYRVMIGLQIGG